MVRRLGLASALIAVLSVPAAVPAAPEGSLRDVGTMLSLTALDTQNSPGVPVLHLAVDSKLNLGLTIGDVVQGKSSVTRLVIYDLARLVAVDQVPVPYFGLNVKLAAVDDVNHRVFFPPGDANIDSSGCASGPLVDTGVAVFDIRARSWSRLPVPCTRVEALAGYSPPGAEALGYDQFKVQALSYYAPSNKLLGLGVPQGDFSPRQLIHQQDYLQQGLLLRQMDATTGALDWEADIRRAGCDSARDTEHPAFIGRYENNVLSYCYGARSSLEGSQGLAIRIPLEREQPRRGPDGLAVINATPTLPNGLFPILDPGSGRLLLLTNGFTNGDAVWVYDGVNERFFGVVASGVSPGREPNASIYAGLNVETGRAYLLTSTGVLVADARHTPLPGGLSYPVLTDVRGQGPGPEIAVAPSLRRLFVPVRGRGFAVIQDDVPEPPPTPVVDPDRGTADIPEVEGKTGRVFSGAGVGFGAHLLVTGGVPRAVNNLDPFCITFLADIGRLIEESTGLPTRDVSIKDKQGRCLAEQMVTSGNRELFLAPTEVELGSETGAAAEAAGGAFPSRDTASDADFKRLGTCHADTFRDRTGSPPPQEYVEFCSGGLSVAGQMIPPPLAMFGDGTRGKGGKGFPIPGSLCEDFGSGAKEDHQRAGNEGLGPVVSAVGWSSVECDASKRLAYATGSAAGLSLPDTTAPLLSIARAWSEAKTELTADGIVTTVRSTAAGVEIGSKPEEKISIGRIGTEVVTRAHGRTHGRTGSTRVEFNRTISDVHGPNIDCVSTCKPALVIDAINQVLGLRARASQPPEAREESPKGYQSIVVKDPATRDSDRAVNDDDTYTVSGLQIVFYNDGREGRNRLVVQLAGVQAESRYGIFLLPEEAAGTEVLGGGIAGGEDFGIDLDGALGGGAMETVVEQVAEAVAQAVAYPIAAAADAVRLIVTNPREFGVLFVMWSLLGSPLYLGLRRRSFARGLGL